MRSPSLLASCAVLAHQVAHVCQRVLSVLCVDARLAAAVFMGTVIG
jgi:hypothetical protein